MLMLEQGFLVARFQCTYTHLGLRSHSQYGALVSQTGDILVWKYINYTLNGTSGQIEVDKYFPMFKTATRIKPQ